MQTQQDTTEGKFVCHMPTFLAESSVNTLVRIASRRSCEHVFWKRDENGAVIAFTTGDTLKVMEQFQMILPREPLLGS